MSLYLQDDNDAFNEIYRRFASKIYSYIRSKISSEEEAQEVFQESILKFHAHRERYNNKHALDAWLFIISRNVLFDRLRKKKAETNYKMQLDDLAIQAISEPLENLLNISEEILSTIESEVVNLRHVQGLSYGEISSSLNISPSNARKILSRAVKAIRDKVSGR